MTSILDSEAHFEKRSEEVGMSARARQSLITAGYSTLGRLAFGVGQPGTPVAELEFTRFATNVLGALATMHDISALRRLLFESQTLLMAQLRDQVSNPDMQMTRKLPPVVCRCNPTTYTLFARRKLLHKMWIVETFLHVIYM